ncbi:T9SS type A sorting domain-containing protein [Dyadobacter arcticus]|uniref:Secretion system C-terminal sorting domain-containing protein n=1 Tax=Dyadobacter arcticus TaxID=1078754 RepID=A0ABX0ULD8_9BACT|nr:T9SS type A sorting domain-containing protein [Dyadobacter arcticus]NIJ52889.1 hypothetical protein [Dyadobacter arcticus]
MGNLTAEAQQGFVSSGGTASGVNGSVTFSIGQPFFSTSTGGTGTVNQGLQQPPISESELPVTLVLFEASPVNHDKVLIHWETANEFSNDFFTVERSNNGSVFEEATRLQSGENSDKLQKYSWTDLKPYPGINYYRLKQTDFDQTFTYSRILAVKINQSLTSIQIYPNPVSDNLNIKGGPDDGQVIFYSIFDLNGRVIEEKQLPRGHNQIDFSGFGPAVYLLQIINGNDFKEFKIIKN